MTESIELTVTIDGTTYSVRCDVPSVLRSSSGPMSIRSALTPAVSELLDRLSKVLDINLPYPRIGRDDLRPSA